LLKTEPNINSQQKFAALQPLSDWNYDFNRCLDAVAAGDSKPTVVLNAEDVLSCCTFTLTPFGLGQLLTNLVSASLVFEKSEGNVGEPLQAQLTVVSLAQPDSAPIRLSEVRLDFDGSLRPIKLQADDVADQEGDAPQCQISNITLRDETDPVDSTSFSFTTSMVGKADLTLRPSHTRVYNLTAIPREAGEANITSVTLAIEEEKFSFSYVTTNHQQRMPFWWMNSSQGPRKKRIGKGRDISACKILPKPPKIHISTPNLEKHYYTNERVALPVAMKNNEGDVAEVTMQVRLFGQPGSSVELSWSDNVDANIHSASDVAVENTAHSISRRIGSLAPASTSEVQVILSNTVDASKYELEISVQYTLSSDPQTPISKSASVDLEFVRPFEANYDFLPRLHSQPWPNLFNFSGDLTTPDTTKPEGIQQKWAVNSKLVSFASEPLDIEKISLVLINIHGGAVCELGTETLVMPQSTQILPGDLRESEFLVNVQKMGLDDRQSVTLDLSLDVHWKRVSSGNNATTTVSSLAMPRFLIPMGEPRILASSVSSEQLPGLVHLDYTLENPSIHSLTFNLTMEASEHFAFSGAKTRVLQMVPLSRHTVRYTLFAFKPGMWIQPHLLVIDTYFNKTLRVLPTEGMQSDRKGILVWVDADGS
jgi:hypothetical protein